MKSSNLNHKKKPLWYPKSNTELLFSAGLLYLNGIKCFKVAYQLKQYRQGFNYYDNMRHFTLQMDEAADTSRLWYHLDASVLPAHTNEILLSGG